MAGTIYSVCNVYNIISDKWHVSMGIIVDKITAMKRQLMAYARKFPEQIAFLFGLFLLFLGGLLTLAGGYLIVSQLVLWLKSGVWVSIPLLYLFTDPLPLLVEQFTVDELQRVVDADGRFSNPLHYIHTLRTCTLVPSFSSWLVQPEEWVGVQVLVRWTLEVLSTSFTMITLGIITSGLGMFLSAEAEDELNELEKGE